MKGVQHMKTIEDLYLGKISPCENMIRGNDKYKDLLRLYSNNQEKLLSTLTEEQKERYEKIHDCADELCNELEKQSFINGFSLGVQLVTESLTNYD